MTRGEADRSRRSLADVAGLAVVVGLFVFGLAIRLASIRSSLWLDEFSTLWAVESGLRDVLHRVPQVMGQSPFYFVFAWISIHVFGESEAALRLPSLVSVAGAAAFVGLAAARLNFGRRHASALWAAVLFWLSYQPIWESVDARPYGLSLLCAAAACAGFTGACLGGGRGNRALWILGAAGTVWSHYIFLPFLAGLVIPYALAPGLRQRYPWRRALTDAGIACLIALPAGAQALGLVASRDAQRWIFQGVPVAILMLIAPFAVAAFFPSRGATEIVHRQLRAALLSAIGLQLAALAVLLLLGFNLIETRYAIVIVVPAAVLAGDRLGRLSIVDTAVPILAYALCTVFLIGGANHVLGSWSGAGFQEWRQAVAALRPEVAASPGAPVLFRSGNAEDDLGPPGVVSWPATLAPLRSPGERPPDWNVIPLTYRWASPARSAYFDEGLAARLAHAPAIFLLCLRSSEPGSQGYCGGVLSWITERWPGRFTIRSLGDFRSLVVVRLDERP